MATITVSTTTQLKAALAAAQGGDVIQLASGIYSAVSLQNMNFSAPVTITSADFNHPATLIDLTVNGSSGINFSHVEMNASGEMTYYKFMVSNSSHVNFDHVHVLGEMGYQAFAIKNSSYVSVTNSDFEQMQHGLGLSGSDHIVIANNSFHDLRSDGVRGVDSSYVTITGNSFTNFHPIDGDHPDAIQFYTSGSTSASHDILITDNVITRGDGAPVQGIFFRDQVGSLPYDHLVITDNMLVGTLYNGIAVLGGVTVAITDNIVASLPDQKSWIRVESVSDVTLTNDQAAVIMDTNNVAHLTASGNTEFWPTATEADQLLQHWLSTHSLTTYGADATTGDTTTSTDSSSAPTTTTTSGSTNTTDTGTSTTDSGSTGGTTTTTTGNGTHHSGTKGHQVMHALTLSSDTTVKMSVASQTSAKVASTSTLQEQPTVKASESHLPLGPHMSDEGALQILPHAGLGAAHHLPSYSEFQTHSLGEWHADQWIQGLFDLHSHNLI